MARAIPRIEIADHADAFGVGRPHREADAGNASVADHVRSERPVTLVMGAFVVQVQLEGG